MIIAGWQDFDRVRYAQRVLANCPGIDGTLRLEGASTIKGVRYLQKILRLTLVLWRNPIPEAELEEVGALTNLRALAVFLRQPIESLEFLSPLRELSTLRLNIDEGPIGRIPVIAQLASLTIGRKSTAATLVAISQCKRLSSLDVSFAPEVSEISSLSELTNLERISVRAVGISDLSFVGDLTRLRVLQVSTHTKLTGLMALRRCPGLTSLRLIPIPGQNGLNDVGFLSAHPKLRALGISCAQGVQNLDALHELKNLVVLELGGDNVFGGLSFLREMKHLRELSLPDLGDLTDISILKELKQLRRLFIPASMSAKMGELGLEIKPTVHSRIPTIPRPSFAYWDAMYPPTDVQE